MILMFLHPSVPLWVELLPLIPLLAAAECELRRVWPKWLGLRPWGRGRCMRTDDRMAAVYGLLAVLAEVFTVLYSRSVGAS